MIKKLLRNSLKTIGLLFLAGIILLLVSWVRQPKWSSEAMVLQEEHLSDVAYRQVADSSIALLQGVIEELKLPSLSVAVHIENDLVWAGTFGYANWKKKTPSQLDTRYRTGSVSKSMTGLLAGKLVASGQFDLDQTVRHYLPEFPEKIAQPDSS